MAAGEIEGVAILGGARMGGIEVSDGYVPDDDPYYELAKYKGSKTKCDNCGRTFRSGEVISVASGAEDLAFCYSDAGGGCVMAYVFSFGKALMGHPMRFGDQALPERERTPNYPASPVRETFDMSETEPGFWQKVKNFFS
ncbi:MAG: hypothetical protein V4690_01235 [Patescibacteria group bacterium]